MLSWDAETHTGVMGLVRYLDRWWDALDESAQNGCRWERIVFPLTAHSALSPAMDAAANVHNARFAALQSLQPCAAAEPSTPAPVPFSPGGAPIHPALQATSGYDLSLHLAASHVPPGTRVTLLYGRAPTAAEMLPAPTPPRDWGGPNDVFDFDVQIGGRQSVAFAPGSSLDIWFPFVLDDALRYRLSFLSAGKVTGPLEGSIFDNTLHFTLPAFTMAPGDPLTAGIDGWY